MCFPIRAFALTGRPFGGGGESQGVATLCPGLVACCPFRASWQSVRCVPSFVACLVWLFAFFFLFSRRFCARWVLGYGVRHVASLHFVLSLFGVSALKWQQATSPGQSVATPWDLCPHMALRHVWAKAQSPLAIVSCAVPSCPSIKCIDKSFTIQFL